LFQSESCNKSVISRNSKNWFLIFN
jgi:hypothetical protein